ncbi:BTAD domain-containing putative transcriptional regulator [Streptomyces sp. TG1A-8]|uniref:AfsR/SARP family transcriptional regulator n=1 Tax=Streptomyces sp. TG1A-8 TaxID=3051385 RepID=UPI00265BB6A3|nr:BTAD domain-containing putative transcriptional regulator [Streptomyces sp. TG1A-8]MDO0929621.1 BTAD domain-containing putative transcriptional regulator [Streptomyces sp. TG1A-8]
METAVVHHVLWGEHEPRGARGTVHTYVYRPRPVLAGCAAIGSTGTGYVLTVRHGTVDVHRFEQGRGAALRELRAGRPAEAAAALREALRACSGARPVRTQAA